MKQFFEAGTYKLSVMYNGSSYPGSNEFDMWINQDQIVRCVINGNQRTYVLSNGDRVDFIEEEPF